MNILHINCNYLGTSLHQTMIEKLECIGIKNTVYVPTYDNSISTIKCNSNVVVSECFNKWDRSIFDYKQKKILEDIQSKVDITTFDCIHAYTLFTDGNVAMNLSKKYNIPYVVAIRNTDLNTFFKYMVHLRSRGVKIMKNASAIFFLSESYRKYLLDNYIKEKDKEVLKDKIHIIPNGIDDFWYNNSPEAIKDVEPLEINLVYAGRIDKNKNITTIQKAIRILKDKGYKVKLTVVGRIDDKKEYNRIIMDHNTQYIPPKTKEQLIHIYRENDIFVMPSFKETFGLVYAEAMSQGLPVIYTKGQGFDGQFSEGEVGHAVIANNPQILAMAIDDIHKNIDKYQNNVNKSKKFKWDDIVLKYNYIYKESTKNNNDNSTF